VPTPAPRPTDTLGAVVSANPARAKVLDEAGIDYCCGGRRTLEDACAEAGLALGAVTARLVGADRTGPDDDERDWRSAPLQELCDHIVDCHHAYLEEMLPRLGMLADKVASVHGGNHPELGEVKELFDGLAAELTVHLLKEEQVLFPAVRLLGSPAMVEVPYEGTVAGPIRCMLHEHDDVGVTLGRLTELTSAYNAPGDACGSYTALYAGLAELDRDLRLHIHEENNVLFPRALTAEHSLRT